MLWTALVQPASLMDPTTASGPTIMASHEGFAVDASLIEADANRQRSVAATEWKTTEATSRPVREYLAVLDENTWGAATDVQPKFISDSDPAAQWAAAKDGPAPFAYSDNYLTNLRSAVILFVEGSRSVRLAEGGAAKIMIERMAQRFDLKPEWQGFHYDKVCRCLCLSRRQIPDHDRHS
jgi:hypothetical protein